MEHRVEELEHRVEDIENRRSDFMESKWPELVGHVSAVRATMRIFLWGAGLAVTCIIALLVTIIGVLTNGGS